MGGVSSGRIRLQLAIKKWSLWTYLVDLPIINGGTFHSYVELSKGISKIAGHHLCMEALIGTRKGKIRENSTMDGVMNGNEPWLENPRNSMFFLHQRTDNQLGMGFS